MTTVTEVRPRKLIDGVIEQISQLILRGDLKSGDRLPSERDLCVQFGIHRSSLREALGRLEALGLIRVRHGSGMYVCDYRHDATFAFVEVLLASPLGSTPQILRNLQDFRLLAQREMARLAAENRDEEDVSRLRELLAKSEREEDPAAFQRLDWEFFHTMVRASKNAIFSFLQNSVRHLHETWGTRFFSIPGTIESVRRFHRLLFRAIERKDGRRAMIVTEKLLAFSNPILLKDLGGSL